MKKNLFWMFLLLCAVSFLPSCSDDDDDKREIVGTEFDGVYKGTLDVKAPTLEIDVKNIPQKVYITKMGENLFKLQLKNFSFGEFNLGTIEASDLVVVKNGNSCTFNGNDELDLIVGKCKVDISGSIVEKNADITIGVTVLDGTFKDLKVDVKFAGTKMAADQSSEAKISSFTINTDPLTEATINGKNITFDVADTIDDFTFTPTIEISAGAKITPESGKAQNFATPVKYTVVSEDGITTVEYTVSIIKKASFDFEEWVTDEQNGFFTPVGTFGSTNGGSAIVYSMLEGLKTEVPTVEVPEYCVRPTDDAKVGEKAALLQTIDLTQAKADLVEHAGPFGGIIAQMCPNLTSGSLFLGTFQLTDLTNPLTSTKFGAPYAKKPIKFTGWYKYTPGEVFKDENNDPVEGKIDECAIYAVLYEAEDAEGNEVILDGTNINTSDLVILRAELEDGTAKDDWTHFELDFKPMNNKEFDANKAYKLVFVCSSSKEGDLYRGAGGSTLTVDDLEIIVE